MPNYPEFSTFITNCQKIWKFHYKIPKIESHGHSPWQKIDFLVKYSSLNLLNAHF